MTVKCCPLGPKPQIEDGNGNPAVGYTLGFFAAGSSTPQNTYTDAGGLSANSNPLTLNSLGQPTNEIWFTSGLTYKAILKDASGVVVWTIDNLSGINDTTSSQDQWVAFTGTPTFVSATSFTLSGDQTSTFQVGRRVKTTNTGGTIYSTIKSSVFGASTTVTVVNDSSVLDAGLSAVSYGLLSTTNDSMARGIFPTMANMQKAIYGLTYANNASDATNDLDISAGGCVDSTGVDVITVAAITKQSDVAWAVGTGNGGLDTGAVGNSDYYIWAIKRVDTQVTDILYSLSSTAPTMPANYTLKRLIGWFKRVGGTIVALHTYELEGGGLELTWDSPTLDVNLANTLTTARRTDAVKVPLNFSVIAHLNVGVFDATNSFHAWIYCPDQTDLAPVSQSAPLGNSGNFMTTQSTTCHQQLKIRTSATGTIAARADLATVDFYGVVTVGFSWSRRT